MADFNISGRMSVKALKNQFKNTFGLELRVYKGKQFADESETLARVSDKKVEDFTCKANMQVGNFETKFKEATGITVQVAVLPDAPKEPGTLINNTYTLGEASRLFKP
jgi:hypothetical protein